MMDLQTIVDIPKAPFCIEPEETMLFVGSCFAAEIGGRATDDHLRTIVNPYGVMYNPASVCHTVIKAVGDGTIPEHGVSTATFTLGTNHVYILNETGEIVDNCMKRPQNLFTERELSIDECAGYLRDAVQMLRKCNSDTRVILTVSPIRYRKYGYHGSQLSKSTLLLAADKIVRELDGCMYFPAYELMNDELRDYRFYKPDMLHPSEQAADYIYEHFKDACFSRRTMEYINEWRPIRQALSHRPLNPDAQEYVDFMENTRRRVAEFNAKWKL